MKKNFTRAFVIATLFCSTVILSISAITLTWFMGPNAKTEDSQTIDGKVGLRGYFYAGNGEKEHKFEIVTPTHFYNLTRLQNLGIFNDHEKAFFQIGHYDSEKDDYFCIDGYDSYGNPNWVKYLDMQDMCERNTLLPIGGEGTPFVGDFDGHSIPVKNLVIRGYPEDIGVFGYVSYEGVVKNLICDNLEIQSIGYTDNTFDNSNKLFSADIDKLFEENATGFNTASLALLSGGMSNPTNIKHLNSTSGTALPSINNPSYLSSSSTVSNEYGFRIYYPTGSNKGPFSYSFKSSSPLVKLSRKHSNYDDLYIDLETLKESNEFNSGENSQIDARISIVASIEVDGYKFSRVIQSYTCEFYSNGHAYDGWLYTTTADNVSTNIADISSSVGVEGEYRILEVVEEGVRVKHLYYRGSSSWIDVTTMDGGSLHIGTATPTRADWSEWNGSNAYYIQTYTDEEVGADKYIIYKRDKSSDYYSACVFCDYEVKPSYPEDDKNTNYHHGTNIGLLAGHVDGTFENSYVYNGKFKLDYDEGFVAINTESQTGLIGEIGTNVVNTMDPDEGLTLHGEIGIMNFTRVYGLIRDKDADDNDVGMPNGDGNSPKTIYAGREYDKNFISYSEFLSPTVGIFSQYLRKSPVDPTQYITCVGNHNMGNIWPDNWHEYTLPSPVPEIYNSVDFLWNKVISDDRHGFYVDTSSLDLYTKKDYVWSDPIGTHVFRGSLAPSNEDGNIGDYVFNTLTGILFRKKENDWGDPIPARRGEVNPTVLERDVSGDYYIQTTNSSPVLWRFNGTSWDTVPTVTCYSGEPTGGNNNDLYIDTTDNINNLYQKLSSVWVKERCLYGSGQPSDSIGSYHDPAVDPYPVIYIDVTNSKIYKKVQNSAPSWSEQDPFDSSNESVSVTIVNTGPASGLGAEKNYYIDKASFSLFQKESASVWGKIDSLSTGIGVPDKSFNNSGDRGMGVFKIVTSYNEEAKNGYDADPRYYITQNMGDCQIINGEPRNKVYFSTAEWDRKSDLGGDFNAFRATSIPSYADLNSMDYPFSRDYNYCFELDLSQMNQSTGQYMYNTDSSFLTHYLYNQLIDKSGSHITPGTSKFGFLFVTSENKPFTSLSSYMPVGKPGAKSNFGTSLNPQWYPSNCIAFHIDNSYGANVSVIGSDADITIYENDTSNSSPITPLYTMKSAPATSTDGNRFFTYDYKTGETGSKTVTYGDYYIKNDSGTYTLWRENSEDSDWTQIEGSVTTGPGVPEGYIEGKTFYIDTDSYNLYQYESSQWKRIPGALHGTGEPPTNNDMKESDTAGKGALYAHIFKLEKDGDYVIGSDNPNKKARLYFLAVQGQTEGTIGANKMAGIGNSITNVDFLTAKPEWQDDILNLAFANFSFKCEFNTVSGEYFVGVDEEDGNKFKIVFSDYDGQYVTYLLTFCRKPDLTYYISVQDGLDHYVTESYPSVNNPSNESITFRTT